MYKSTMNINRFKMPDLSDIILCSGCKFATTKMKMGFCFIVCCRPGDKPKAMNIMRSLRDDRTVVHMGCEYASE